MTEEDQMDTDYFYEDCPECDVVVELAYSSWRDAETGEIEGARTIGAMANSDKGVTFLTAYCCASGEIDDEDQDFEIGSATFEPEELDRLKRQAALAGVSLKWTG
jgi:hypothetical protein